MYDIANSREYHREGPYFVLSFLRIAWCYLKQCIAKHLSIISAAETQTQQHSWCGNYYKRTSGRGTELKL